METWEVLSASPDPWVRYRTFVDLLEYRESQSAVSDARAAMLSHPLVEALIRELKSWPGVVLSSHKSAGQHYHKLAFLADLGLTREDPGVQEILNGVLSHSSEEGLITLPMVISTHHGGNGQETWAWALCDAPVSLYALAKMGYKEDPLVIKGRDFLIGLIRENGWPCKVSKELGDFRGPGKKEDPCPYVNLILLKFLSLYDQHLLGEPVKIGVETLLDLWENSLTKHPYIFYMGTDFRKLKAPFIWYDILHVLEVLSRFEIAVQDPRFEEMLNIVLEKADQDGLFTPESVWQAWKGWDFGQKKTPSLWMTFIIYRIQKRLESFQT
ncbi:hypothetical protein [Acidaminobacter hydrogenoformans]|uniref:Uncharacterized protein n=1 Tax=Acidaminobacter hydrogenoformans DSM 2784 TaxID=1120920 RepID=A0A1G5S1C1_9FIRM|nr:hypothetical protein [Acidaminobacter hydrogenoformans]SCZ80113.1 hypothetical protein SAMN03080599_02109 [Acidaminobacter hydrogenoformans DSM 2784]